ncbi:HepT-like ribonuclease domain-containing protein [Baaleninema simplex]|uniref:HepT-like ribonuclease domain-containing protein n=1 Tax=Baaleninema simplex TaxID=2862350 RepID=UPI00034C8135|nr:DUF86 domain-containing protein [Baaleninema simplex]
MRDDRIYLQDIYDRIDRVEIYMQGGKSNFFQSSLIQDGVIRNFEVIGEAVKRLFSELRQRYPKNSWRIISGFRDVLIHDYTGIDLNEVWNVVEHNLPKLKRQILNILLTFERNI